MKRISAITPWVVLFHNTTSTITDTKNIIDTVTPAPDELLVIADTQSKGVGRTGNYWFSPIGGLWFTYSLYISDIPLLATLKIGYILYETLIGLFPSLKENLRIKWPNDLIYKDKKMAGILVNNYRNHLITGIGINTNIYQSTTCSDLNLVSLDNILGFDISNSALLELLIPKMKTIKEQSTDDPDSLIKCINDVLYLKGKQIRLNHGNEIVCGILSGITNEGAIEIIGSDGHTKTYLAGSIIT